MDFSKPELLNLFFILIPIVILFIVYYNWQKNIIIKTFNSIIFSKINPHHSNSIKILHFVLRVFVIIFLIFGLCGPRIGTKLKTVKREGVDVIFALDVSKSMLVEDVAPNRLLKSIQIISKTIDRLVSDRMGLIVYAGQAYPLMPLSFDYSMAKLLIKTIDTDLVPSQGTDFGSAIVLADSFFDNQERSRILFIISDGEDHEGSYTQEINNFSDKNIVVCSINIGTESGGPIPIKTRNGVNYKKDKDGNIVISKSNSETLRSISSLANGNFIKTKETKDAVSFIFDNMKYLDKTLEKEEFYSDYENQFQWFLGFALFFILIDFILTKRRINIIEKLIN